MNFDVKILNGDWLSMLRDLPDKCAQVCVTSPPYWNLRNYGIEGQIGQEHSPDEYVSKLVTGVREVHRVLVDSGTLWLNLGDTYAGGGNGGGGSYAMHAIHGADKNIAVRSGARRNPRGFKSKDLIGIPWMVAFALRADGWYLRSEITWCKKVPMPESVTDRPTAATEKIFLLSKSRKYFYNADAVRNPASESWSNDTRWKTGSTPENEKNGYELSGAQNPKKVHRMFDKQRGHSRRHAGFNDRWDAMPKTEQCANGSNMRNYLLLGPEPYSESHFATFPSAVPRKAILAGSNPGDTVLDCFAGSGTTGKVAIELGRKAILIEINPDYCKLIDGRCHTTTGLPL